MFSSTVCSLLHGCWGVCVHFDTSSCREEAAGAEQRSGQQCNRRSAVCVCMCLSVHVCVCLCMYMCVGVQASSATRTWSPGNERHFQRLHFECWSVSERPSLTFSAQRRPWNRFQSRTEYPPSGKHFINAFSFFKCIHLIIQYRDRAY